MLTVFRRDFPGGSEPTGPPSADSVGTDGELPCFEPGRQGSAEDDTARIAVALGRRELELLRWAMPMLE
jgi:hypothetical protein